MLRVAFALLVFAVATAAGVNMIRTAPQTADTERQLLAFGDRTQTVRLWTYRIGGAFLLIVGLAVLRSAVAHAP